MTDTVFLKNSNSIIDDMSNHIINIGGRGGSYCKFIMLLRTTKNKQYERLYLFKTSGDGHYFLLYNNTVLEVQRYYKYLILFFMVKNM